MLDELLFTENLIVVQKDAIIDSSKQNSLPQSPSLFTGFIRKG
jgi:hypothetical protein